MFKRSVLHHHEGLSMMVESKVLEMTFWELRHFELLHEPCSVPLEELFVFLFLVRLMIQMVGSMTWM